MINQTSETTLVQGTVADAAMTVTLTDGAADIDLSSATIPRNYPGCKLTIKDSAGREIVGWIYTNGAGTVQNIVSTKGGTTRNWAYKNGSFDTTDDYTYRIDRVHVATAVASGSIAAGSGKLSLVDGTAFADTAGLDLSPYADGKHLIVYYDSSNRSAAGWLKAAGGGETLTEKCSDPTFDTDSAWTKGTGWSVSGGNAVANLTGQTNIYQLFSITSGQLYKGVVAVATTNFINTYILLDGTASIPPWATTGTQTAYRTAVNTGSRAFGIYGQNTLVGTYSDISFGLVTAPSATGATIVNAKDGTTYNWLWKTTGFDPNVALTYKIYYIGY